MATLILIILGLDGFPVIEPIRYETLVSCERSLGWEISTQTFRHDAYVIGFCIEGEPQPAPKRPLFG